MLGFVQESRCICCCPVLDLLNRKYLVIPIFTCLGCFSYMLLSVWRGICNKWKQLVWALYLYVSALFQRSMSKEYVQWIYSCSNFLYFLNFGLLSVSIEWCWKHRNTKINIMCSFKHWTDVFSILAWRMAMVLSWLKSSFRMLYESCIVAVNIFWDRK
jgi:hypothetical protein